MLEGGVSLEKKANSWVVSQLRLLVKPFQMWGPSVCPAPTHTRGVKKHGWWKVRKSERKKEEG